MDLTKYFRIERQTFYKALSTKRLDLKNSSASGRLQRQKSGHGGNFYFYFYFYFMTCRAILYNNSQETNRHTE